MGILAKLFGFAGDSPELKDAITAREALNSLTPEFRARAIIESMLSGASVAFSKSDLDKTFFRVLDQMKVEVESHSMRAIRLEQISQKLISIK